MLQSKLCHICKCLRADFEKEGYNIKDVDKFEGIRSYWYQHDNGNRITIVLNLNTCVMNVYKNALLIKQVK